MDTITVNSFQETGTQYCLAILEKLGCPSEFAFNPEELKEDKNQICILKQPYTAIVDALYISYQYDSNSENNDMSDNKKFNEILRGFFDKYEKFLTFPYNENKVLFITYEKLMTDPETVAREIAEFFSLKVNYKVYEKINKRDLYDVLDHHVEGTGNHVKIVGGHRMSFKSNYDLKDQSIKKKAIQVKLSKTIKLKKKLEDLQSLYLENINRAK